MKELPPQFFNYLANKENTVLLETSLFDALNHSSYLFSDPIEILKLHKLGDLNAYLEKIEDFIKQGFYLAGYFSYECGYFAEKLQVDQELVFAQPLAWFGVYGQPIIFDHNNGAINFPDKQKLKEFEGASPLMGGFHLKGLHFNLDEDEYGEKIERIKEYIRAGETYQINFTGRYRFNFAGSPLALYQELKKNQKVSFGAYIQTESQKFLSFSPELFFQISGNQIITRPMKGTVKRGETEAEDQENARWLQNDAKNRAENVMIVDLLRNDIGQLCEIGSVQVPEFFTIEKYKTLFQMTSKVIGTLKKDISVSEIFHSLFPSGSITGAPKLKSMQIIKELETTPRGIYTGAIGFFAPASIGNDVESSISHLDSAVFNVAIRTIALSGSEGEMGIGSGIVYDSTARDEFNECAVKANFLTTLTSSFALLDAILWDKKYVHLDKHLNRLLLSADYLGFNCDLDAIRTLLGSYEERFQETQKYKVRIQLEKNDNIKIDVTEVKGPANKEPLYVKISNDRIDSTNPFLYHKTTNRQFYDQSYNEAVDLGFSEVIFLNEKQQVTEGAISNIVIEKNGQLFTPPLHCGLLNGIYRECLIEEKLVKEKILWLDDLKTADKIYVCNSIRGLREVILKFSASPA